MESLKQLGIVVGGVAGGIIGGTLSVVGKVAKIDIIDEIGESVVDSALVAGRMAGNLASGTVEVISGKVNNKEEKINAGIRELKNTGDTIITNFKENIELLVDTGAEISQGVKEKNLSKVKSGAKNIVKVATVGILTVGVIKVKTKH